VLLKRGSKNLLWFAVSFWQTRFASSGIAMRLGEGGRRNGRKEGKGGKAAKG